MFTYALRETPTAACPAATIALCAPCHLQSDPRAISTIAAGGRLRLERPRDRGRDTQMLGERRGVLLGTDRAWSNRQQRVHVFERELCVFERDGGQSGCSVIVFGNGERPCGSRPRRRLANARAHSAVLSSMRRPGASDATISSELFDGAFRYSSACDLLEGVAQIVEPAGSARQPRVRHRMGRST